MITLVAILVAIYAGKTPESAVERLGWGRSSFDEYLAGRHDAKRSNLWFHDTLEDRPTEIVFPQGGASERFYINQAGSPAELAAGSVEVLQYETKRDGLIRAKWELRLTRFTFSTYNDIPKSLDSAGTLIKLLYREGLKPRGKVSPAVRAVLNAKRGYASYCLRGAHSRKFWYWFTSKSGRRSVDRSLSFEEIIRLAKPGVSTFLPALPVPYPVAPEEIEACALRGK